MFQHDFSLYVPPHNKSWWGSLTLRDAPEQWPDRPFQRSTFLKSWAITQLKAVLVAILLLVPTLIAFAIMWTVIVSSHSEEAKQRLTAAAALLAILVIVAVIGVIEERGMRMVTGRLPIWPVATLSVGAGLVAPDLVLTLLDPDRASTHHSAWHLVVGAVGGAMAGWLVLRARFQRAWWWLWAMAALALVSVASNSLGISGFAEQLSGLLQTLGYVVLSGLALWEISKNPRPDLLPDRTVIAQVLGLALLTMAASIAIQ